MSKDKDKSMPRVFISEVAESDSSETTNKQVSARHDMMPNQLSLQTLAIMEAPDDEHLTERFSQRSKVSASRPLTAQMSMVPMRTKLQGRKRKKKSKEQKVQIETVTKIIPVGLNYMQTFLEKQIDAQKKVTRETQTEQSVGP